MFVILEASQTSIGLQARCFPPICLLDAYSSEASVGTGAGKGRLVHHILVLKVSS